MVKLMSLNHNHLENRQKISALHENVKFVELKNPLQVLLQENNNGKTVLFVSPIQNTHVIHVLVKNTGLKKQVKYHLAIDPLVIVLNITNKNQNSRNA